ncbi:GTP-binding protein [Bradyrhizobium sp. Arg68]|uniref:CobW family GTP-binding protein n=1 Tax=Bradyrhizobium ivorense TaxID=2511166 RepID=UPI001E46EF60|nr:GTP-binding protein [Bradyrhizobium ivorense]MCC8936658.1 GTP-binding protein [Bradyrhizobium ivorense]
MSEDGLDFYVLTGFLGSGKTTLLRDFLELPEAADTAVIVNEAGEIGLDGVVLRESGGELPIAELANGCVCCQIGSDLAFTIDRLMMAPRPPGAGPLRRIILETSGLSMPGPVLRTLATLAEHRMRVAVIGTFDLTRGSDVAEYEEAVAQWAAAHRIVTTKADLAAPAALTDAPSRIADINPVAEVVTVADRIEAVQAAFAPLTAPPRLDVASAPGIAHPRVALCLARPSGEVAYPDLAAWLDNVAGALGERLLRIKGLVQVAESPRPLLIECVGTTFSPPRVLRIEKPPFTGLVIIARDAAAAELAQVAPAGLFKVSPWKAPEASNGTDRPGIKAEWVA